MYLLVTAVVLFNAFFRLKPKREAGDALQWVYDAAL